MWWSTATASWTSRRRPKPGIGYLPEQPPLYMDMTVEEYLAFCAQLKKVPLEQQEHQLREVIAMTQLEPVQSRLIGNLSKGYRQRVGLAPGHFGVSAHSHLG